MLSIIKQFFGNLSTKDFQVNENKITRLVNKSISLLSADEIVDQTSDISLKIFLNKILNQVLKKYGNYSVFFLNQKGELYVSVFYADSHSKIKELFFGKYKTFQNQILKNL